MDEGSIFKTFWQCLSSFSFKDYLRCAGNPFSFFVYLGYLTPKIMDENTKLLQYDMDWETFQRVLYYTKKYYGMDSFYFY